jgi:isopenicillin N synthase-like dioxygenase
VRQTQGNEGEGPGVTVVPVIDVEAALAGEPEARGRAAAAIDAACRTSGFFAVTGHGVDPDVIDAAVAASRAFFALPFEEKKRFGGSEFWEFRGYLGTEDTALAATLGEASPPDLSESFNVARFEGDPVDESESFFRRSMLAPNRWPARPVELQQSLTALFGAMEATAFGLVSLIAEALDLPADWFASSLQDGTSLLLVNHYPPVTDAPLPGQLRRGAHTDYGILTLLYAEAEPGLQISVDGGWVDVPPVPGGLICNIGDLMARWVNGRWVSTLHRVVVPEAYPVPDRVSIPFFFQPRYDAVVEPAPTTVTADAPARFKPVVAGEWIAAKSAAMLPDED